jgi:formate dehydrogenase maturation protein FdhE
VSMFDDEEDVEGEEAVEDEVTVTCPYCGEATELVLDPGGGTVQDYIEDCQVCCQPWHVHVQWRRSGQADVHVEAADE